jgi:hypothetical protein
MKAFNNFYNWLFPKREKLTGLEKMKYTLGIK